MNHEQFSAFLEKLSVNELSMLIEVLEPIFTRKLEEEGLLPKDWDKEEY
jgi:hypothetical protein